MTTLLTLESDHWRLELAGPLRGRPDFLPVPESRICLIGDAKLCVASSDDHNMHLASNGSLVPRSCSKTLLTTAI